MALDKETEVVDGAVIRRLSRHFVLLWIMVVFLVGINAYQLVLIRRQADNILDLQNRVIRIRSGA